MGRTYLDFEQYIAAHPDCSVVEMDVVEGAGGKSSPCPPYSFLPQLLFLYAPFSHGIWLQSSCHRCLCLSVYFPGARPVFQAFSVILTDNRTSFRDPSVFERKNGRDSHTLIFYCGPMASWQKGRLEKNNEFICYLLPKGATFSRLTQPRATLPSNHINSTTSASLNGCTPFELALLLLDKKLLDRGSWDHLF